MRKWHATVFSMATLSPIPVHCCIQKYYLKLDSAERMPFFNPALQRHQVLWTRAHLRRTQKQLLIPKMEKAVKAVIGDMKVPDAEVCVGTSDRHVSPSR